MMINLKIMNNRQVEIKFKYFISNVDFIMFLNEVNCIVRNYF